MRRYLTAALCLLTGGLAACGTTAMAPAGEVVIYASVDQNFSAGVLADFQQQTGITVRAVFDAEAAKTTGLVNRLIAEQRNPQADVFWSGEFVQTVRLQEAGVLAPFSRDTAPLPAGAYCGPGGNYVLYGGRARVFLADRAACIRLFGNADSLPLDVLLDGRIPAAQVGMALPLFGTSTTQAALLWARDGAGPAAAFYRRVQARGIHLATGNASVRDRVVDGQLLFGLTDSDDAAAALTRHGDRLIAVPVCPPVVIPMTVALIAGRPVNPAARLLAEHLASVAVRERLEREGFLSPAAARLLAQIPPELLAAAAAAFPASQDVLRELFAR